MKIMIQKDSPLSIRDQIKRQIRALIENSELSPGDALPSARNLAALITVNRNTVTQAYKELATEGILEVVTGSGTFVRKGLIPKPRAELDRIFDKAMEDARKKGFSPNDTGEHFLNRLTLAASSSSEVLVVDHCDEMVQHISEQITRAFGVKVRGALIRELQGDREAAGRLTGNADLIVCGIHLLGELRNILSDPGADIVGIQLKMDAGLLNLLAGLPGDTVVGCACVNRQSTESLYSGTVLSGAGEFRRILAGYDNSREIWNLLKACDMILATDFVHRRMKRLVRPHQKLVHVEIRVDESSMALIGKRLSR